MSNFTWKREQDRVLVNAKFMAVLAKLDLVNLFVELGRASLREK